MAAPVAPAVPNAEISTISSTESNPQHNSLETGSAGTSSELVPHVGIRNRLDDYFYKEFIFKGTFTWNTGQLAGQLLWYGRIHPDDSHDLLSYVSKIYNTWCGGLEYNFKIAGTGFHAGSLAVVRLPPNITPGSITSAQGFTVFPYILLDPKNLSVVSKSVMDQRNIMYHYRDDNTLAGFGGFVAVYVYLPLATSSTGATQINVNIAIRAAGDFVVAQPRPLAVGTTSAGSYNMYNNVFPKYMSSIYTKTPIANLLVKANEVSTTNDMYGLCLTSGDEFFSPAAQVNWSPANLSSPISRYMVPQSTVTGNVPTLYAIKGTYPDYVSGTFTGVGGDNIPLKIGSGTSRAPSITQDPSAFKNDGTTGILSSSPANGFIKMYNPSTGSQNLSLSLGVTASQGIVLGLTNLPYPALTKCTVAADTDMTFPSPIVPLQAGEVLVYLVDQLNIYNMCTLEYRKLAKSQALNPLAADQVILFLYSDNAGKKIRYFKLWQQGYLTTSNVTATTTFNLDPVTGGKLEVVGVDYAYNPLPTTTAMLANERRMIRDERLNKRLAELEAQD
jgi:hypothetical protein